VGFNFWKQRKAIILPRQARRDKQHGEDSNKTDRRVLSLFSALYDLLDATGQMCWDENRDYGAKYGSGVYAVAMRDMVKRDRNHASIIMWCVFTANCIMIDHFSAFESGLVAPFLYAA
jgi:hypothetical protein